jgi:hypothetical protein
MRDNSIRKETSGFVTATHAFLKDGFDTDGDLSFPDYRHKNLEQKRTEQCARVQEG